MSITSITVGCLAFVGCFLAASWMTLPQFTVRGLEREVQNRLPAGSDAHDVRRFLESQAIDYSETGADLSGSLLRSEEFADIHPFVRTEIGGVLDDTQPAIIGRWGIRMIFFFTAEGKLIGHKVNGFCICP
jgi:hypothetical protein